MIKLATAASLAAAACGLACGGDPTPVAGALPEWRVDAEPRLTIGRDSTDPLHELAGVTHTRRLPDGRILVANSRSHELRLFASDGKGLSSVGRRGQGPGEFGGDLWIFPSAADSLLIYDGGWLRWSVFSPQVRFARQVPEDREPLPRPTWLYDRTLVYDTRPRAEPAWVLRTLDGLGVPRVGAPLRRARLDDAGYLWVSDSTPRSWRVFADSGREVASVTIPDGLELHQAGEDFVLGLTRDSLGVESVRLYGFARLGAAAAGGAAGRVPALADAGVAGQIPPPSPEIRRELSSLIRNLMTAQEAFYSDHRHYATRADSLPMEFPPDLEVLLLAAGERGWVAVLYNRPTRTTCGAAVGWPPQPGWGDGTVICGRAGS